MAANVSSLRVAIRVAAWLLGVALPAGDALAQAAKDLVGTWMITSATAEQGGTKTEPYSSDPKGILMLDENGRYALMLLRPDLPHVRVQRPHRRNRGGEQGGRSRQHRPFRDIRGRRARYPRFAH